MLVRGWNYFLTGLNEFQELKCKVCNEAMNVERNIEGANGWASAMAGRTKDHDEFSCPNSDEKWHEQALEIKELINRTPSAFFSTMLEEEVNLILRTKCATK